MTEIMTTQNLEKKKDGVLLPKVTSIGAFSLIGALSLLSPSELLAQTVNSTQKGEEVTDVTQFGTRVDKQKKTISLDEAIQLIKDDYSGEDDDEENEEPGIEPDPESNPDSNSSYKLVNNIPTQLSVSTGVGYTIGGDLKWVNRIQGSGEIFPGTKGATEITGFVDFDDPLHSEGSGKISVSKRVYNGISFDGDYTFTGTGKNILRFGFGYKGKVGKGVYKIDLFPLNTNGSPIAIKLFTGGKLRKGCKFSSVLLVDFDKNSYNLDSDLNQMVEDIAKNFAVFFHMKLGGKIDGKLGGVGDTEKVSFGLRTFL